MTILLSIIGTIVSLIFIQYIGRLINGDEEPYEIIDYIENIIIGILSIAGFTLVVVGIFGFFYYIISS